MEQRGTMTWLFALLTATSTMADEPRPLPKEFQGEWIVVAVEFNGQRPPEDIVGKLGKDRVTIKENRIPLPPLGINKDGFFIPEGGPLEVRCRHDSGSNSKEIDLIFKNGDEEIRMRGIYALEGKQLKICWQHDGKGRPKEFKAAKDP